MIKLTRVGTPLGVVPAVWVNPDQIAYFVEGPNRQGSLVKACGDLMAVKETPDLIEHLLGGRPDDPEAQDFEERGMGFAANTLAQMLGVSVFEVGDGSESAEGNLKATLMNILDAAGLHNPQTGQFARIGRALLS